MLSRRGRDLPIAIVRPSIVESSTRSPFAGWNEGINTSGPLSYLLGTNFRQLPTNERKCLDVIPVDMVCRGMTLIASAVVARRHARATAPGAPHLEPYRRTSQQPAREHRDRDGHLDVSIRRIGRGDQR